MPSPYEKFAARVGIPLGALGAIWYGVSLPHNGSLPAVALGTTWIFYAQRALALFFGFLLLYVPVARSLATGHLPIELSSRGVRYAEQTAAAADVAIGAVEKRISDIEAVLDELPAIDEAAPAGDAT